MAKKQQPKASWLDRRREAKRVQKEKRAQRIADQRPATSQDFLRP
jgi:hypothetical protein